MRRSGHNFANHTNTAQDYRRAKNLRQSASIIEKLLWQRIRQLSDRHEIKFRRQHPIHPYIVDFACIAAGLVIEIDGMSHDIEPMKDQKRQRYIEQKGFRVIRFANSEVMANADAVAEAIILEAQKLQQERWRVAATPPRIFPAAQEKLDPPQGEGG